MEKKDVLQTLMKLTRPRLIVLARVGQGWTSSTTISQTTHFHRKTIQKDYQTFKRLGLVETKQKLGARLTPKGQDFLRLLGALMAGAYSEGNRKN